jgi:hypothetical protein
LRFDDLGAIRFQSAFQLLRVRRDNLDRASTGAVSGDGDLGRDPSVRSEGQPFEEFLFGPDGIAAGRLRRVETFRENGCANVMVV